MLRRAEQLTIAHISRRLFWTQCYFCILCFAVVKSIRTWWCRILFIMVQFIMMHADVRKYNNRELKQWISTVSIKISAIRHLLHKWRSRSPWEAWENGGRWQKFLQPSNSGSWRCFRLGELNNDFVQNVGGLGACSPRKNFFAVGSFEIACETILAQIKPCNNCCAVFCKWFFSSFFFVCL